jgi:hypothetical protein
VDGRKEARGRRGGGRKETFWANSYQLKSLIFQEFQSNAYVFEFLVVELDGFVVFGKSLGRNLLQQVDQTQPIAEIICKVLDLKPSLR